MMSESKGVRSLGPGSCDGVDVHSFAEISSGERHKFAQHLIRVCVVKQGDKFDHVSCQGSHGCV